MTYRVVSNGKYITHRAADCHDCEWYLDDYANLDLPAECRRHVQKTGHTVGYESAAGIIYRAEKGE